MLYFVNVTSFRQEKNISIYTWNIYLQIGKCFLYESKLFSKHVRLKCVLWNRNNPRLAQEPKTVNKFWKRREWQPKKTELILIGWANNSNFGEENNQSGYKATIRYLNSYLWILDLRRNYASGRNRNFCFLKAIFVTKLNLKSLQK